MLTKSKMRLPTIAIFMAVAIFIAWLPLPFKPSLSAYFGEQSIRNNIKTFTDPVFLPDKQYRAYSTFTSYIGWNNAYEIRYQRTVSPTQLEGALMFQFTAESAMKTENEEGPETDYLANLRQQALNNKNCEVFDEQYNIRYCKSDLYGYLIRSINYQNKTYFIASVIYNNKYSTESIAIQDFRPERDSIRHKVIKSLSPVDIKSAEDFIKII